MSAGRCRRAGKTNPICRRDIRATVRNEPNLAARDNLPSGLCRTDCAKRSQTWGDWGTWAKTVVVRGVPRLGSETCKTNPICPRERRSNCAKRTQFPSGRAGASTQNKANSGRGQEMVSAWWGRAYGELANQTAPAEQSQFLSRGPMIADWRLRIAD
jgi:hypothetical protein